MNSLLRVRTLTLMFFAWSLVPKHATANFILFTDYTLSTTIQTEMDVGGGGTSPTLSIVRGGVASSGGSSDFAIQSFNSSSVNVGDGGRVDGGIGARDSSSILLGSGSTTGGVKAYDTSHVAVGSTAEFGQIFGYDSAQITVNGGNGEVAAAGHSTATINDGFLGFAGSADSGQMTMNDGQVGTISAASTTGEAQFALFGGTVTGDAIAGDGGTLAISDGDIQGNLRSFGGSAFLLGGTVGGSAVLSAGTGGGEIFLAGGEVDGNALALAGVLTLSGSTLQGSVVASGLSEVDIKGGMIDGSVIANGASTIIISGGTILGNLIENGGTIVRISGGLIDDPSALGWYVNDTSLLDIDGFGLGDTLLNPRFYGFLDPDFADSPFPYNQYSEYLLSGNLLNGTSVDGKLLFVENGTGAGFELVNEPGGPGPGTAPEPASIGLVAIACIALGMTRRFAPRKRWVVN